MPKKLQRQQLLGKKLKKYNFVQLLGNGSFGTVYKAVHTKNNDIVAIKAISKTQMKQIPKLEKLVASQIAILKQVKNENVIKFIDSFSSDESVFIATQFCNGGDLQKYCAKNGQINESQAVIFLKQILNGFKGLHENNTMHRDFKLANVLLHNNVCKIADLGFAKQLRDKALTCTLLGTDETMAPQVHQGKQYGWGADIWSLGVVFYQMLYARVPFKGANDYEILRNIKMTKPNYSDVDISQEALDFIQKCLVSDPSKRITWKQIYDHPLIKKSEITLTTGLLRSKVSVQKNKTYYQLNEQQQRKTIRMTDDEFDLNSLNKDNTTEDMFQNAGQIKAADHQADKIRKTKEEIQNEFVQYEIDIIHTRNNKMFGINQLLPFQKDFKKMNIQHSKALYEICKRSFIDMKNFRFQIQSDSKHFKSFKYWKQFKQQQIFKNIKEQLLDDQLFAESLTIGYKFDLTQDTQFQNMNRCTTQNKYADVISRYRRQLTPFLKDQNKKTKLKFIKMLKALQYMEQNSEFEVQTFHRLTDNIDVNTAEKELLRNL